MPFAVNRRGAEEVVSIAAGSAALPGRLSREERADRMRQWCASILYADLHPGRQVPARRNREIKGCQRVEKRELIRGWGSQVCLWSMSLPRFPRA